MCVARLAVVVAYNKRTPQQSHNTYETHKQQTCARAAQLCVGNTDGALPCSSSSPCCPIRYAREAVLQSPRRNMENVNQQQHNKLGFVEIHSTIARACLNCCGVVVLCLF